MAAPTNISALTATVLGPNLPTSVTQNVHDAGTTYTVWYSYTAQADETVIGLFAYGSFAGGGAYSPKTVTFLGPASSPVAYLVTTGSTPGNRAVQIPVTPGLTYYFQFPSNAGNPTPALLTISVEPAPVDAVTTGSIMVNDDTEGFPVAAISDTTGEILRFVQPFVAGECGDVLEDGTVCVCDGFNNAVYLYDTQLVEITHQAGLQMAGTFGCIRTCQGTQRFWLGLRSGSARSARYITSDGTLGPSHALTAITAVRSVAAANDESVLYHCTNSAASPIHVWDLVNDVALADLVAGISSQFLSDILVLSDDSILACYSNTGTGAVQVKHYSAAGATLHTYSFGTANVFPSSALPRLAYAIDDPVTFWIWTHPSGADQGLSLFQNVTVSSGAIASSVTSTEYESGVYNPNDLTITPTARFGNSYSCPFWVARASITPPEPPFPPFVNGPAALEAFEGAGLLKAFDVPRVRVVPHLADENQRLFYSKFQLDCECGSGLVTGQGVDPVILLRYSDDGGFTWSSWRQLTTGALGVYRWRCIAWRLGMARDRVFMIRQTDPVKSAWLTAYIDFEGADA